MIKQTNSTCNRENLGPQKIKERTHSPIMGIAYVPSTSVNVEILSRVFPLCSVCSQNQRRVLSFFLCHKPFFYTCPPFFFNTCCFLFWNHPNPKLEVKTYQQRQNQNTRNQQLLLNYFFFSFFLTSNRYSSGDQKEWEKYEHCFRSGTQHSVFVFFEIVFIFCIFSRFSVSMFNGIVIENQWQTC